jgi:hypothetical protein
LLSVKQIRSVQLTLQGLVIVALLTGGTYAVLLIQTSPSDERGIIAAALNGESQMLVTGKTGRQEAEPLFAPVLEFNTS